MLVPAGFLVLMVLASISVDSAVTYLAQRQLGDALAGAANDAATAGIDDPVFYAGHGVVLDPASTDLAVCRSLVAEDIARLHHLAVSIGVNGAEVRVDASATVDAVFGRLVPGFGRRRVSATATAEAEGGPSAPGVAPTVVAVSC